MDLNNVLSRLEVADGGETEELLRRFNREPSPSTSLRTRREPLSRDVETSRRPATTAGAVNGAERDPRRAVDDTHVEATTRTLPALSSS
ncbi:hypothetical protein F2P81_007161 [Scophthalmus maximus]|uniref:Uncharacterized protein n=1 Tax=Scophthalmus maximus TaxID=52904 RepID=A0A6A4T5K3_SCOMX|nr:hypothetical protein F2P81_007161 [Scophthalmus maximus]